MKNCESLSVLHEEHEVHEGKIRRILFLNTFYIFLRVLRGRIK